MHHKQELCRQTVNISELSRAFVQRDGSGSAAHASGNPPRSPGSCCWAADFGTWNQKGDDRNENAQQTERHCAGPALFSTPSFSPQKAHIDDWDVSFHLVQGQDDIYSETTYMMSI